MENYSSGWRGAPAKGVGRETGARVQIPPSPFVDNEKLEKSFKKGVDKKVKYCYSWFRTVNVDKRITYELKPKVNSKVQEKNYKNNNG